MTSSFLACLLEGIEPMDLGSRLSHADVLIGRQCIIVSCLLSSGDTLGWEDKLETASLEKHAEYLRERQFVVTPHPLEATAWENGFVPETQGLPSDELELRMLPLLPQLSYMVSAPRQHCNRRCSSNSI